MGAAGEQRAGLDEFGELVTTMTPEAKRAALAQIKADVARRQAADETASWGNLHHLWHRRTW